MLSLSSESIIQRKRAVCHCQCCLPRRYKTGMYVLYGEVSDYTRKGGVVLAEIHLPKQAPERFKDREILWNEVEWIEGNKKAQLAHSFDIALMNEFSMEENIELQEDS